MSTWPMGHRRTLIEGAPQWARHLAVDDFRQVGFDDSSVGQSIWRPTEAWMARFDCRGRARLGSTRSGVFAPCPHSARAKAMDDRRSLRRSAAPSCVAGRLWSACGLAAHQAFGLARWSNSGSYDAPRPDVPGPCSFRCPTPPSCVACSAAEQREEGSARRSRALHHKMHAVVKT